MRRGLSKVELDFLTEGELPHMPNETEANIFQGALNSMQTDEHGMYVTSEVDKLFDDAGKECGKYDEINPLTNKREPGWTPKGHILKTFVLRNIRALLRSDTTER